MNFYIIEDSLDSNFYTVILFYLSMSRDLLHNLIIGKSTLQIKFARPHLSTASAGGIRGIPK